MTPTLVAIKAATILSAICLVESSHNPSKINWKDKGAPSIGYCGLKLKTARGYGFKGDWKELKKQEINLKYAAMHFEKCRELFKSDAWTIACYNAGEPITEAWKQKNLTFPKNTDYIGRVYTAMELLEE